MAGDNEPGRTFRGSLYAINNQMLLSVESKELYAYFSDSSAVSNLVVNFFHDRNKCTFSARFSKRSLQNDMEIVELFVTSLIKETSRRANPRFSIRMLVGLYVENEGHKEQVTAETDDISLDAANLFTYIDLNITDKTKFTLEFTLFGRQRFLLPATLIFEKPAPKNSKFKHQYVLKFDYSRHPEEKERFLYAYIESSLESQKSQR